MNSDLSYEVMEDFIYEIVKEEKVKNDLLDAINRNKPFRRFKDKLLKYPKYRELYFDYSDKKEKEYIMETINDIIEDLDVEIELV